MAHFIFQNPEISRAWSEQSDFLAILSVKDEQALELLRHCCIQQDILIADFREPDIGDELTAIALEPCEAAQRLTAGLPLAMREYAEEAEAAAA